MPNFDKIIFKRHHVIVNEEDVMKVLKNIQKNCDSLIDIMVGGNSMGVGNCGWSDTSKWFIHFTCSNSAWKLIKKDLSIVRLFSNTDIPKGEEGRIYTTD